MLLILVDIAISIKLNLELKKRAVIADITEKINKLYQIYKASSNNHVKIDGELALREFQQRMKKMQMPYVSSAIAIAYETEGVLGAGTGILGAGAGVTEIMRNKRHEPLTVQHQEQLQQIEIEVEEQNQLLGEIEEVVDNLLEIANQMGDELDLQSQMIESMDTKASKTQDKLDAINDRLKHATAISRERPICCYLLCFILLVIVAFVLLKLLLN
jgi:hypothetical protein